MERERVTHQVIALVVMKVDEMVVTDEESRSPSVI